MVGLLGHGQDKNALEVCLADAIDLVSRLADFFETPEEIVGWIRVPQIQWGGLTAEQMLIQGRSSEIEHALRLRESSSFM